MAAWWSPTLNPERPRNGLPGPDVRLRRIPLLQVIGLGGRPTIGAGVLGTILQASGQQRLWEVGVYGELGISRAVGSNFSLGVLADLQVRRTERSVGDFGATVVF